MPIPAVVAGAGISALGSIVGNIFGNSGAKRRQDRANRQNIEFWRMQNEYNHPSAQMARLRAAGLNPNMIYGTSPTSAVGNSDGIAPSKAPEYKIDNPLQDITKFADIRQREAQTNNLSAQNTVLAQEAVLKAAQTQKTLGEGVSAKVKGSIDAELRQTSADLVREDLRAKKAISVQQEVEARFKNQSLKNRLLDIHYRAQNARATLHGTQLSNALKKYEIELNQMGIQKDDNLFLRLLGKAVQQANKPNNKYKSKLFKQ